MRRYIVTSFPISWAHVRNDPRYSTDNFLNSNVFSQITVYTDERTFCIMDLLCEGYHYNDVIMSTLASQITSHTIVYLGVYSSADQRKYQSSTLLAFGIINLNTGW